MTWNMSKSADISCRCDIFKFAVHWDLSFSHRWILSSTLSFIAEVDGFLPLASKCASPAIPFLTLLHPSLLKRARAICQVRTSRPGHSQVAACRGHVHAPYTSPGSGVAVGLKGRYTHRELRWGRPTGTACVGVGDSTPLEAHPSGDKKNRDRGRPAP